VSCPHSPTVTHDAGTCPALRPELTHPMPARMRKLPVDGRGYPVPWFVLWLPDGTPEFRAMDSGKWKRAVKHRLCWTCGEPLGKFLTFVIGPMCGVNRVTSEPANHLDCAIWSATNCPFLSRPQMARRDVNMDDPRMADLQLGAPGSAIVRNPGVTLLWTTLEVPVPFKVDGGVPGANPGWLLHIGDPVAIRAYREGREATRAEITESVRTGLPSLQAVAAQQGMDAVAALKQQHDAFTRLLATQVP